MAGRERRKEPNSREREIIKGVLGVLATGVRTAEVVEGDPRVMPGRFIDGHNFGGNWLI